MMENSCTPIYYQNQTGWNCEKFGELNAELNKLFLIGIEYHFTPDFLSRSVEACKQFDMEIRNIEYDRLSEETKCIMVAILNQQKRLYEFVEVYENLSPLVDQKPLKERLFMSKDPCNLFPPYMEMNVEY